MRYLLFASLLLAADGPAAGLPAPLPGDPCIAGPWILVRGTGQNTADIHAGLRAFLSAETGDAAPKDPDTFQVRATRSVVKELKLTLDSLGAIIMPRAPCGERIEMNDAEVREFMLALLHRFEVVRPVAASVGLMDTAQGFDAKQPTTPPAPNSPPSVEHDR